MNFFRLFVKDYLLSSTTWTGNNITVLVNSSKVVQRLYIFTSVTSKKSPIVYKSCPKMISLEELKIS